MSILPLLNFIRHCFPMGWIRNRSRHYDRPHDDVIKFSALLVLRAGNSRVTGEFPSQRPMTQRFDVFFDLCLNKRLSKQSWGWWSETPSRPLWRHCSSPPVKERLKHLTRCTPMMSQCSCDHRQRWFRPSIGVKPLSEAVLITIWAP